MLNELILMKPSFYSKREMKREKIENEAGIMDSVMKGKADDLNDQYKRVFKLEDRTVKIIIAGPLSPSGPDAIDVYLGYDGTAYKNIERAADEAFKLYEDGRIDNVIIRMNTPGGTVDGVDAAHNSLKKLRKIAVVKNDGMIASAGVWLASAIDRIEPTVDSALFGSIGVVATYMDYSGYYDNFGIKMIDITNKESSNKRPDITTAEGYAVIEKELDDLYDVFASKVTANRAITKDQIDALKGEMLIASKAISMGFMDAPQNDETSEKAEAPKAELKIIKEVPKVELTEEKIEIETVVESVDIVIPAISAERARIFGIMKLSNIELSDEVKNAIDSNIDIGAFAVGQVDSKNAKVKAEVDAAKALRAEAKVENIETELNSDTHTKVIDSDSKIEASINTVCSDLIGKLKKGVK